jgi:hypothetical protein
VQLVQPHYCLRAVGRRWRRPVQRASRDARKGSDAIKTAFQEIKSQTIDQFATLSATDIIKKLLAIIGDLLVNTVENILITAVDILETLAKGLLDAFTATISIPILSPLYKSITGNDLSMLDLVCLIIAIPATVVYKLIKEEAAYPRQCDDEGADRSQGFCRNSGRVRFWLSRAGGIAHGVAGAISAADFRVDDIGLLSQLYRLPCRRRPGGGPYTKAGNG